jgi:glycosyltransferase involved in cell wall biosynthesis
VRDALPDALIVVTFHEYLSICHHHGQMVKTGAFKLCYRASPTDCNACFPDILPARFLARETFIKGMLGLADHFVSPSRFLVDRYVDWGLAEERFSVIENGIDVAGVAPPRPLPEGKGRRSRFAYFGQLTPYKGADVLIDAVTRIPEDVWGEDSILLVYGGNLERQPQAYQDKFAKLVEAAGRRVRFCGAFQNREMPNLMRSVDWMVMPSVWWPPDPGEQSRRHGREDHRRGRWPAFPARQPGRPRRLHDARADRVRALGPAARRHQAADEPSRMRRDASRPLPPPALRTQQACACAAGRRRDDRLKP